MLENIKAMINQKNNFAEAAQIIFENVMEENIDNLIILNESDDDENEEIEEPDNEENTDDDSSTDTDNLSEPEMDNEPSTDTNNLDTSDADNDLLDSPMDDYSSDMNDISLDSTDDTSNDDDINNLLDVEIDLGTNTINDILPVPPTNAGDAVGDDELSTRINSGFGNDEPSTASETPTPTLPGDDLLDMPMDDPSVNTPEESPDNLLDMPLESVNLKESISLTGDTSSPEGSETTTSTEAPPDEGQGQESDVTSAVRDKVAEANPETNEGDLYGDEISSTSSSATMNKEELFKKLSNITKSVEDAKAEIVKHIT